ncbi:SsrA-binding protein SmpB [bacterium endosymbiont of Pedicinus badii]|uniref:SsrA-binding protein SmpB n=1 Tax=bacterium endosymbiont of Pedicinus badii TaxID=1719126 RepID=UPI0009CC0A4B|nr:SsrA-binding protein SmpB [bacterium endosymbiont of Pedicinus badii]OQM34502.1 hypothetical protein AOQ89_01280 [bacterium endosymbiont of Pedicinus badii]
MNRKHTNIIIKNKLIRRNYLVKKNIHVGILLLGWEVKSVRKKKIDITKNFVYIKNNEVYLENAIFHPCSNVHLEYYKIDRTRKLLLKKKEIIKLFSYINRKGYTAVIESLFWKKNFIKGNLVIALGKKKYDKRISVKNREWKIKQKRILKKFYY